jgi:hypothetical protein
MPLTWSNRSQRRLERLPSQAIKRDSECSKLPLLDQQATLTTQFRLLDSASLNKTIPAFLIDRNMEGFWIAGDGKGRIGGIFLIENSALPFAMRNSKSEGRATIFPSERPGRDLGNRGSPLARPPAALARLTRRSQGVLATFSGKVAEVVRRLLRDFRPL